MMFRLVFMHTQEWMARGFHVLGILARARRACFYTRCRGKYASYLIVLKALTQSCDLSAREATPSIELPEWVV